MTTIQRALLFLSIAAAILAPSRLRADDKDDGAGRTHAVLRRYCRDCHTGPAARLKGDLPLLDYNALLERKVVRSGRPDESELFQLVDCGSMPPGDLPKPGPEEVRSLREWIVGGAPDFPPEYGDAYVLKKIRNDLLALDSKVIKYQRYVSFNHLLAEDPGADPAVWRDALLKALNHLSWRPGPVTVAAIDPPANTVFRIDERQLGWDVEPFETVADTASNVDLFDLLLLEYPFATLPSRFDSDQRGLADGDRRGLADYVRRANPVRPILYVRGDWLVSTATQPPLYEDLMRLPRVLTGKDGLEAKIAAVPPEVRGGFLDSRASALPQLVERRPCSGGAYWRTFDLGAAKDMKGLAAQAGADAERGGLMLFSLPNGLNGYYIAENVADEGGKRLTRLAPAAPKEWVADPVAADQVARNGLSCMRCHDSGVQAFREALRPALDALPLVDRQNVLPLFPGAEALNKFLAADADRFQAAVKAIHGRPLDQDPLTPVTRRFLQKAQSNPLSPNLAAGGVESAASASDGTPHIAARLPAGDLDAPPLPPLDGLTFADYAPPLPPVDVSFKALNFKTKQHTTTFLPGDQLALEVTNSGAKPVWIELIGAFMDGHMTIHEPPRELAPGATYQYPKDRTLPPKVAPKQFIEMGLPPGVDRYVLFAADAKFPAGVHLRSVKEKDLADRVVHPFWVVSPDGTQAGATFDPTHLVKKTLFVETRER